ncbi:MAG: hypothetical protein M3256_07730 [Actinomycetota bacterium]|nr:hypothetical protein [Actinomycetota bacterium]
MNAQTLLGRIPPDIARKMSRPGISSSLLRLVPNSARIEFWNRLGCSLDVGCYISPLVGILAGTEVSVGRGSALLGRIEIAAWGAVTIGSNVLVNKGSHFLTGSHDIDDAEFSGIVRPIVISDQVWIAQGAIILPGVQVGEGAVVGAYAVVGSDVPARTVVVGNPATPIRKRNAFDSTFVPAQLALSRDRWRR